MPIFVSRLGITEFVSKIKVYINSIKSFNFKIYIILSYLGISLEYARFPLFLCVIKRADQNYKHE